ncbi:hypothetical protein [Lysobacter terrae]
MSLPAQRPPLALVTELPQLDEILAQHTALLGADFAAYRNHCYRVANFCIASASTESREVISVAAAFHDLGIWMDGTFDYLEPSRRCARQWLDASDHQAPGGLIEAMICQHHKVRPYRGDEGPLVEVFRRADWLDVSRGMLGATLPRKFLAEVFEGFPNAGFHRALLRLTCRQFIRHPLRPLPMMRW